MHVFVRIVRHGETQENKDGVIQGQLDTKLNDTGFEQARLVGLALQSTIFEVAYTSDLSRAAETAKAILVHHPDVVLKTDVRLRERCLGELQGRKGKLSAPFPPSVETYSRFTERCLDWWESTIIPYAASLANNNLTLLTESEPIYILVVSHGGFITTLIRALVREGKFGVKPGLGIGKCHNASITTLQVSPDGSGKLVSWSDRDHLTIAPALDKNADEVDEKL